MTNIPSAIFRKLEGIRRRYEMRCKSPLDNSSKESTIDLGERKDSFPGHKGVPGQGGGSAPSGVAKPVTRFRTAKGTMHITSDLAIKASKSNKVFVYIKAGGEITNVRSFAGKGSGKNLVQSGNYAKMTGTKPKDWSHKAGEADVVDMQGIVHHREIHWFEHPTVGQMDFKVKYRG